MDENVQFGVYRRRKIINCIYTRIPHDFLGRSRGGFNEKPEFGGTDWIGLSQPARHLQWIAPAVMNYCSMLHGMAGYCNNGGGFLRNETNRS